MEINYVDLIQGRLDNKKKNWTCENSLKNKIKI